MTRNFFLNSQSDIFIKFCHVVAENSFVKLMCLCSGHFGSSL